MFDVDKNANLRTKMAETKDWADEQDLELAREGLRAIKQVFFPVVNILGYLKNEAMGFPAFELAHSQDQRLWVLVTQSPAGAPEAQFFRTGLQPDRHGRYQPTRIEWTSAVAMFRQPLRDQLMGAFEAFLDRALAERDRQRADQQRRAQELEETQRRLLEDFDPRDTPKP